MDCSVLDEQTDRHPRVQHRAEPGSCDAAMSGFERKALRPWPFLLGDCEFRLKWPIAGSQTVRWFLVGEVRRERRIADPDLGELRRGHEALEFLGPSRLGSIDV